MMKNTSLLLVFTVLGLALTMPAHAAFVPAEPENAIDCTGKSEPVKSNFPPHDKTKAPADKSSS